jgi:hypothetical protein
MKSKIQTYLTHKQLKLSSAERNPGPSPSAKEVKDARLQFAEANRVLRQARHCIFHERSNDYLLRLFNTDGDFAKRRALRNLSEGLQVIGIYSDKAPISSVENMVLTRLYRMDRARSKAIVPIKPSDSSTEWKTFCDKVAGPSYWRCLTFCEVEAAAKAKAKAKPAAKG